MRLQLALNVHDLGEAVRYYGTLFDTEPHKLRPGYANFAIDKPPLKLVLFENRAARERLHHLGVEVVDSSEVDAAAGRWSKAGILERAPSEKVCCHAVQNKIWSSDPQGLAWEWYHILDDDPSEAAGFESASCCDQETGTREPCCS